MTLSSVNKKNNKQTNGQKRCFWWLYCGVRLLINIKRIGVHACVCVFVFLFVNLCFIFHIISVSFDRIKTRTFPHNGPLLLIDRLIITEVLFLMSTFRNACNPFWLNSFIRFEYIENLHIVLYFLNGFGFVVRTTELSGQQRLLFV